MGSRIAAEVRRALITAAKTGLIMVAGDGLVACGNESQCGSRALCPYIAPDSGGFGGGNMSTGGKSSGTGGRPSDSGADAPVGPDVIDAGKDGG
jgi:hypothetical protein